MNTSLETGAALSEQAYETLLNAYKFALQHIGNDFNAGAVWAEYVAFLRGAHASTPYEEGVKMDRLRGAFQHATSIPLSNVETLWRDYDQYENGLNRLTAKKIINERSQIYMAARLAAKELKNLTEPLHRDRLAFPPDLGAPSAEAQLTQHFNLREWKRLIEWEKSNPLHVDEGKALLDRVYLAYKQSLMHLRYFPEIWYQCGDREASFAYIFHPRR